MARVSLVISRSCATTHDFVSLTERSLYHGVSQRPASGRTPMGENGRARRQPDGGKAWPRASASGSIFMVETGEDHGVQGDKNMETRPRTERSAQNLFCTVDSVLLARFLRVET